MVQTADIDSKLECYWCASSMTVFAIDWNIDPWGRAICPSCTREYLKIAKQKVDLDKFIYSTTFGVFSLAMFQSLRKVK